MGINHFETARGYGTSELQYVPILQKVFAQRSDYILQTKCSPQATNEDFHKLLLKSFASLQIYISKEELFQSETTEISPILPPEGCDNSTGIGYVDLFAFHGVNKANQLEFITREGGNLEVIRHYQRIGKLLHIGSLR